MFPKTISTPRLLLRPIEFEDAEAVFYGYARDSEVTRFLTWRPHASIEDTQSFIESSLVAERSCTYVVLLKTTGEVVGSLDLRAPTETRFEVGYALARQYWGIGLMTEALTKVVEWALHQPNTWRIGAVADVENGSSIRVMEKAGLKREGILCRWLNHPNISLNPRDCVSFAATRK